MHGMKPLKRILTAMLRGAVLLGLNGIFVGAIVGMVIWPRDNVGPLLGMVYGLSWGAVVGALLGFGLGMVRLFAFKPSEGNPRVEQRITLWKLLSENQRFASKVGLLVFGSGVLLFVLGQVLVFNLSGRAIKSIAVASLFLGMLALCVSCVVLVIRLHSTKKAGKG